MGETGGEASAISFPALTIPPRPSYESFFNMSSFSPGPMSLVSSFLSEQSPDSADRPSFSQLLAGVIASPTLLPDDSGDPSGSEKSTGYRKNRPMNLALAQSPLFMIPSGFSPSGFLNSPGFLSPLQSPFGMSHQQALAHVTAQAECSSSYMQMQAEDQCSAQVASALGNELLTDPKESSLQIKECLQSRSDKKPSDKQGKQFELTEVPQFENKTSFGAFDKSACDGYNWRKYGQKKVKATECPRSYYKCTHLKCPAKKKVEKSVDGHITEITYNGRHNHAQPTKQRKDGSALDSTDGSGVQPDISTHDWTVMNSSDGSSPSHSEQVPNQMASELLVKKECDETKSNLIEVDEGHDEPDAKRTKMAVETLASSHGTVAESKIILQTRSEVDILDDGYRWRKYGQKAVKGTQHPRSYYRCTYAGCNVRKQVERASTDPKAVITTYEGKHNHDIPTVIRNRGTRNTAKDTWR
ncbi:putative WRKY transcription factor 3 [Capsicum chacoense]